MRRGSSWAALSRPLTELRARGRRRVVARSDAAKRGRFPCRCGRGWRRGEGCWRGGGWPSSAGGLSQSHVGVLVGAGGAPPCLRLRSCVASHRRDASTVGVRGVRCACPRASACARVGHCALAAAVIARFPYARSHALLFRPLLFDRCPLARPPVGGGGRALPCGSTRRQARVPHQRPAAGRALEAPAARRSGRGGGGGGGNTPRAVLGLVARGAALRPPGRGTRPPLPSGRYMVDAVPDRPRPPPTDGECRALCRVLQPPSLKHTPPPTWCALPFVPARHARCPPQPAARDRGSDRLPRWPPL